MFTRQRLSLKLSLMIIFFVLSLTTIFAKDSITIFMKIIKLKASISVDDGYLRNFIAQSSTPYATVEDPNEFDYFVVICGMETILFTAFVKEHKEEQIIKIQGQAKGPWVGPSKYKQSEIPEEDPCTGLKRIHEQFGIDWPVSMFGVYKISTREGFRMIFCYTLYNSKEKIYKDYTYCPMTKEVGMGIRSSGWFNVSRYPPPLKKE